VSDYSFATWLHIPTATTNQLLDELAREWDRLAYDLKICGAAYPSPRKESIRRIHVELERRGVRS
jgi:hypothetical protein